MLIHDKIKSKFVISVFIKRLLQESSNRNCTIVQLLDVIVFEIRMNEEQVRRVLAGDFQDLPSVSSRVVRIFTSSTFTGITLIIHIVMQSSISAELLRSTKFM